MSVLRRMMLLTVVFGGLSLSVSSSSANQMSTGADTARPLTTSEVYRIYSHNSWLWKDGSGYFSVPKRQFKAWSGKGRNVSVGEGIWFIIDPGKLCFRATWYSKGRSTPATTCFSHREKNGLIYQRREPDGNWYIFRHAPAKKGDEIAKIRRGDYVSKKLDQVMRNFSNN